MGTSSNLAYVRGSDPLDSAAPNAASFVASASGNLTASFDGTTLTVGSVVAVPEPETYALMLGGLAAVGFVARRRRSV